MGAMFRLLSFIILIVAAEAALILRDGPLKDSESVKGIDQHGALHGVLEEHIVPAEALEMPAMAALERMRSIPLHDLEACASGFCTKKITGLVAEFETHVGAVELVDMLVVNFCLKSPFSSQIPFCRNHRFAGVEPDMQDHEDSAYMNLEVMNCILETPQCNPVIREHLGALLHDKD